MSQDTPPTNSRVPIAILGTKVDTLTEVVLKTNANVDTMRREQSEMRQEMAVNEERWRNHGAVHKGHGKAHEADAITHAELHKRERGIVGTVILVATTVSGSVSAWWASR